MSEEELRKITQEEIAKQIRENIDSALIFQYVSELEEKVKNQDKIIDLMIDRIEFLAKINNMGLSPEYDYKDFTKEDIKEYFKKQIK